MAGTDPPTTPIHDHNGIDRIGVAETDGGGVDVDVDVDDRQLKMELKSGDLSLTPPRTPGGESLPVSVVERRMRSDGYQKYVDGDCDQEERRIVYFLFGRELGKGLPVEERRTKINRFIANAETIARMSSILPFVGSASSPLHNDRIHENRRLWRKMQEMALRYEAHYNASRCISFEILCCMNTHMKGSSCTTIFRGNKFPYIQILQRSNSCYITAAATIVSYLLTIPPKSGNAAKAAVPTAPPGKVKPVDASRYIRRRFSNEDLEERVVSNVGGSSMNVLRDLVGSDDDADFETLALVRAYGSEDDDEDRIRLLREESRYVVNLLARRGPALVSRFDMNAIRQLRQGKPDPVNASSVVYMPSFDVVCGNDVLNYTELGRYKDDLRIRAVIDGFENANTTAGANDDESSNVDGDSAPSSPPSAPVDASEVDEGATSQPAYHAMVLIGSRFDKKAKKHWFLLQNSWRSLPLLEVSDTFMARHLTDRLVFVRRGVAAADLSSVLSTHSRLYQECGFDDGGDSRPEPLEDNSGKSSALPSFH